MNSVFLCFLFLILSPSLVRANSLYEEFMNSYHGSDIVIDDTRYAFPVFQAEGLSAQTINDTQIFNVLAQILGTPQMLTGNPLPIVQKVNMFSRPLGSLFFSIEGYTPDYRDIPFKFLNSKSSVLIERSSRPYHPSSFLATSVTSKQAFEHGVFSKHDSVKAMNIFDLVTKLYQGATVVGASLKETKAKILAPKINGHSIFYNRNEKRWIGSLPALTTFEVSEMKELGEDLHFEASHKSIKMLLKEVAFVYNAIKVLPTNQAKYFLAFHFESPKQIAREFGTESATFNQALRLIDSLLHLASQSHSSIQVLYFPSLINPQIKEVKKTILPHIEKYLKGNKFFPEIPLTPEGREHKAEICAKLREVLKETEHTQTNVFCTVSMDSRKRGIVGARADTNGTGELYDVEMFHTFFWIFLLLIAGLIYAMYGLAYIEPDRALEQSASYVKKNVHQKWQ